MSTERYDEAQRILAVRPYTMEFWTLDESGSFVTTIDAASQGGNPTLYDPWGNPIANETLVPIYADVGEFGREIVAFETTLTLDLGSAGFARAHLVLNPDMNVTLQQIRESHPNTPETAPEPPPENI